MKSIEYELRINGVEYELSYADSLVGSDSVMHRMIAMGKSIDGTEYELRINGVEYEYVCTDSTHPDVSVWMDLLYQPTVRRFFVKNCKSPLFVNAHKMMENGLVCVDDYEAMAFMVKFNISADGVAVYENDLRTEALERFLSEHAEYVPLLIAAKVKAELENG